MSVADKLNTLRSNIVSAYDAIEAKSGTVPTYENTQGLANAIATIPQYNPLTLAYISYASAPTAQPFVNLLVSNDTTPAGGASYAFAETDGLTSLDLSSLDFSAVTDTVCMFDNAADLTTLTWANSVDFGNVETMEGMYRGTTALTSVDLSKFETGEYLESLFNMFAGSGVQTVTLGGDFDTSAVTDFYGMFNSCASLATITNLASLDLSSALNVGAMFYGCASLTSLDLSAIAPSLPLSTTNADYMLAGLTSLNNLNLSGWTSASDDLASSHFWTTQSALRTLTLNGPKRLVNGKLADSLVATFSSKQGSTVTTLKLNNPEFFTTDGTTATLTDFSDVWAGSALTTLEMTGWNVSGVDPTDNSASVTLTNVANLTALTIGNWTTPANGVNLATLLGVDNEGSQGYSGSAKMLSSLHITGSSVLKVYNSGTGEFKSSNAFAGCPIGNGTGHILVPANLVDSYKADSFWSAYASIITAES